MQRKKRILAVCCAAHAIQDGLGAALYVILPVLAQTFGLTLTQIGALRAINSGAMALLETLSGLLSEHLGERSLLTFGLTCAGLGYMLLLFSDTYWMIGCCFFITGVGAAFQHALSSSMVSSAHDFKDRRSALGIYNSSGDAGKLVFASLFSLVITIGIGWKTTAGLFGCIALLGGIVILFILVNLSAGGKSPASVVDHETGKKIGWGMSDKGSFSLLITAVFLDTAVQSSFLTFVAFFVATKQVPLNIATFAVTLVLIGGIFGKVICGFMAKHIGTRQAFTLIQLLTAVGIVLILSLDKVFCLIFLPFLGVVLQGSTSITYSVVGDLIHPERLSRGFSLIYTVSSLACFLGPVALGIISDYFGFEVTMYTMAGATLLSVLPMLLLNRKKRRQMNYKF